MSEIIVGAGDSVSRLLQVHAKEFDLKRQWTGNGRVDSRDIVLELVNTHALKDCIWKGVIELYGMPELKELPESVQAKLMSIILSARACAELLAKVPKTDAPPK